MLFIAVLVLAPQAQGSHALGIPIEWKPNTASSAVIFGPSSSHALGIPIEWKLLGLLTSDEDLKVPTRWESQLNGNWLRL